MYQSAWIVIASVIGVVIIFFDYIARFCQYMLMPSNNPLYEQLKTLCACQPDWIRNRASSYAANIALVARGAKKAYIMFDNANSTFPPTFTEALKREFSDILEFTPRDENSLIITRIGDGEMVLQLSAVSNVAFFVTLGYLDPLGCHLDNVKHIAWFVHEKNGENEKKIIFSEGVRDSLYAPKITFRHQHFMRAFDQCE